MKTCASCGEENPDRARFCLACGNELAGQRDERFRKVITLLFCDVIEAGTLSGELDPATYSELMTRYYEEMRPIIERHGGTVAKFIGDAIMSVFGIPVLHEDDALRACRAALELQDCLVELNRELDERYSVTLSTRTGINSGEVSGVGVARAQNFVAGDAANTAARLQQNAKADQIILGESTLRLVRDGTVVEALEPVPMKGKAEPVPIFRLRQVKEDAEALRRRHDAPLVGRQAELELLRTVFGEVTDGLDCRLMLLLADPGVGKSRLVGEFCDSVPADALVLRGRCLSYGEGITFWPLVEVIRQAAGINEDEAPEAAHEKLAALADPGNEDAVERVASVVGLSTAQFPVEEVFWGTRKLLETLALERPVVLVLDDIHWAEPTFLDLIEHVVDTAADVPLLLLCASRHELLEDRPAWRERAKVTALPLRPLSDEEAGLVIENHLGDVEIGEDARARIVTAAEGNPLFVEQMLSMLIDEGLLRRVDGRLEATHDLAQLTVPPSIQALLAARVDRLPSAERAVVEPASVVGLVFSQAAVEELADEVRETVADQIVRLAVKQLVRREDEETSDGGAFRFGHVLIRDAAYDAVLKERRALLHERVAEWTERVGRERGRLVELDEILGYHLEQAHRYRAELGPLDEHGRDLGRRSAERLSSAGRRAFGRNDMRAAVGLLERAAALYAPDDPARLQLLPVLGEALLATGDFERSGQSLNDAIAGAAAAENRRLEAEARLVSLVLEAVASGTGWTETVLPDIQSAMKVLEGEKDHAGLATGWRVLASVHATCGRYGEAANALQRAVAEARLANDRRQELRDTSGYAQAMLLGPTPVGEAVRECERILADAGGDRRTTAFVNRMLAPLLAMQGDADGARTRYVAARAIFEDLGIDILASSVALESGRAEMIAGNLDGAERELRQDYETLERIGEKYWRSTIAGLLGLVLCEQSRDTEALELADAARELATDDDVYSQVLWRRVRAKVLARAGEPEEALQLVRDAVDLSGRTDDLNLRADSLVDLHELAGTGEPLEEALALYERKGNVASAQAVRNRLVGV